VLETLVQDGWSYHDTDGERLAAELEAAAAGIVDDAHLPEFMRLATHTIGEHLGDWPRALRLAETVIRGRGSAGAPAWSILSVARFMAGEPAMAMHAELRALSAAGGEHLDTLLEGRFMLAAALVGSGRAAEAAYIYEAALGLARHASGARAPRAAAVASNNLAFDLLEAPARSPDEDALMRSAAEASHEFWLRCGDWVNEEKALHLRACVANALGARDNALRLSQEGLEIIAANSERPIDAALLRLERFKAFAAVGERASSLDELELADLAADKAPNPELRAWFSEERAKATGQVLPA
jgi:hypothetical protein